MTNNVDVSDLAQLAQSLLDAKTKGQEFMLSQVHRMSRQAYEMYPEDPVIRQFAFVIEQMTSKHKSDSLITQSQMTKIYNDLVRLSDNTRFRTVLGHLLLDSDVFKKEASYENFINSNREPNTLVDLNDCVDQNLINGLNSAFGGSLKETKNYNESVATKGAEHVALELNSLGFNPNITVLGGNSDTLVYAANFDTKSGIVAVAIPLDISGKKILLPSVFVADNHFEALQSENLNNFINKKSSTKDFTVPNADVVLKAVGIATGKIRDASAEELKSVFGGNIPEFTKNDVVEQSAVHMNSLPVFEKAAEMPKELAHLAQDFENDILESVSVFGKDAVRAGKSIVLAELAAAGFKHSQVRFTSEGTDSVYYAASINTPKGTVEIEIPIEMRSVAFNKHKPLLPTYFAYDGIVEDFSPEKLQRFALNIPSASSGQVVCSTAHSYMTLPELKDDIMKSAAVNDYVNCEIALNTIQERFGDEHYKNAVEDYHYILTIKNSNNKDVRKCSRPIAAGHGSIEARCGHYLVPMSKVVVGEDGQCKLKTSVERERLNPIEETSASIVTSKINLT